MVHSRVNFVLTFESFYLKLRLKTCAYNEMASNVYFQCIVQRVDYFAIILILLSVNAYCTYSSCTTWTFIIFLNKLFISLCPHARIPLGIDILMLNSNKNDLQHLWSHTHIQIKCLTPNIIYRVSFVFLYTVIALANWMTAKYSREQTTPQSHIA